MGNSINQSLLINNTQFTRHPRILRRFLPFVAVQQIAAQHRGQGQGYNRRGKQGYNKSNTQRYQHTSFHPRQEKERQETYHYNQCRVQYRHSYFTGSIKHDLLRGTLLVSRKQAILTQSFIYIFHINNRIVHQRPDSNCHTSQAHRVYGQSQIM